MEEEGSFSTRRRGVGCLVALFAVALLIFGWIKYREYRHYRDIVPFGLRVTGIEYRAENDFGGVGLPGDNETGVVVYSLEPKQAQQLAQEGLNAVSRLGRQKGTWEPDDPRRKALYGSWMPTPALDVAAADWKVHSAQRPPTGQPIRIREFLDKYGFDIPVARPVEREIDESLATPGSYFSFARGGKVFILMPARRKGVLAYAG
jgi:hypothetical protein